jgi:hypothetical protein
MKTSKHLRALCIAALVLAGADNALASSTIGKVTFLGTISEEVGNGFFGVRFRVRISGTCDNDTTTKSRFIHVRGGRVDGVFAHNNTNTRNAYTTLLAASLAGKTVQIDGIGSCSTTDVIDMPLWAGNVGVIN